MILAGFRDSFRYIYKLYLECVEGFVRRWGKCFKGVGGVGLGRE